MTTHPSEFEGRRDVRFTPERGEWPCQQPPKLAPPQFVTFLYLLLRDGAQSPGDVEQHAINAGLSKAGLPEFTNPHLEAYAHSLASHLLDGALGQNDRLRVAERLAQIEEGLEVVGAQALVLEDSLDSAASAGRSVALEEIRAVQTALMSLVKGEPGCNDETPADRLVRELRS